MIGGARRNEEEIVMRTIMKTIENHYPAYIVAIAVTFFAIALAVWAIMAIGNRAQSGGASPTGDTKR